MTSAELLRAIRAQPFRPFFVRLADGRALAVPSPEHCAHREGERFAVVIDGDGLVEHVDIETAELREA